MLEEEPCTPALPPSLRYGMMVMRLPTCVSVLPGVPLSLAKTGCTRRQLPMAGSNLEVSVAYSVVALLTQNQILYLAFAVAVNPVMLPLPSMA